MNTLPEARLVPYSTHEGDTAVWFTNNPDKWNVRKRNGAWWIYPPSSAWPAGSTIVFPNLSRLGIEWITVDHDAVPGDF